MRKEENVVSQTCGTANRRSSVPIGDHSAPGKQTRRGNASPVWRYAMYIGLIVFVLGMAFMPQGVALAQNEPGPAVGKSVVGASSVQSGTVVRFRIEYRCGDSFGQGYCGNGHQLVDQLPPGMEFVNATTTSHMVGVPTYNSGTGQVSVTMNFAPGDTGFFYIDARFRPGTQPSEVGPNGTANNEVTISRQPIDPGPPVEDTAQVTLLAPDKFSTTTNKTGPNSIVVGYPGTFTVQLCNVNSVGGANLVNPVIVDTLPPGAIFVSANGGGVHDPGSNTVTWNIPGELAVGACVSRQMVLRYDTMPDPATQTNVADVTGTPEGCEAAPLPGYCGGVIGPRPLPGDTHPFTIIVPVPGVTTAKSAASDSSYRGSQATPGELITYTLRLENTGYLTMTNVVITDTFPAGLEFVSATFGPVPAGNPTQMEYERTSWQTWGSTSASVTVPNSALTGGTGPVSRFRWTSPGDFARGGVWLATIVARVPTNATPGTTYQNCLNYSSTALPSGGAAGGPYTGQQRCVTTTVVNERSIPYVEKARQTAASVLPNAEVEYRVTLRNHAAANLDSISPDFTDLLPVGLEYVPGSLQLLQSSPGFTPTGVVTSVTPMSGTVMISGGVASIPPGAWARFSYKAIVKGDTPPGPVVNTANITVENQNNPFACIEGQPATQNDANCRSSTTTTVLISLSADSEKWVQGQFESVRSKNGRTVEAGTAEYTLSITNTSNVPLTGITMVDILPAFGDAGVIDGVQRQTEWEPRLQSLINAQQSYSYTVFYSASMNPCRNDLVPSGPAGCEAPNWSLTPPTNIFGVEDLALVGSVRINLCDSATWDDLSSCFSLPSGSNVEFDWTMIAPMGSPKSAACALAPGDPEGTVFPSACDVAWNSFGWTAQGQGEKFLPTEPVRVGIGIPDEDPGVFIIGDRIWLDVLHPEDSLSGIANGVQDPDEIGINGLKVLLLRSDGAGGWNVVNESVTTNDVNGDPGYYWFAIPETEQGTYRVAFEVPAGAQTSPAGQGTTATDSNGVGPLQTFDGRQYIISGDVVVNDTAMPTREDMTIDQGLWFPADFGDAPTTGTSYPVTGENAGYHVQVPGVSMKLGAVLDTEGDGQPNVAATGDDIAGTLDDEDGVGFPAYIERDGVPTATLVKGGNNTLVISTTLVGVTTPVYAHIWIDVNGDGVWGPGEVVTQTVTAGANNVDVSSLIDNASAGDTYMRVRLSDQAQLGPNGGVLHGEVEDYRLQVLAEPVKSIIATSEAHTPASAEQYGDNTHAAIGEIVRYRLEAQVPRGVANSYTITDVLPVGLAYLGNPTISFSASGIVTSTTAVITPTPLGGNGEDVVFALDDVVNSNSGQGAEYVVIDFNALVLNVAGNQDTTAPLPNHFDVAYNDYSASSNVVNVLIDEPDLSEDKSVSPTSGLSAGAVVTYTVVVNANTGANRTTAYDVVISDTLDSRLAPLAVNVVGSAGVTNPVASITGQLIQVTVEAIAPSAQLTITYSAQISTSVLTGEVITNTADLVWTGLPGTGTPNNPTGQTPPGGSGDEDGERNGDGGVNDYHRTDGTEITVATNTTASLGDYVWEDTNADGIQDAGESGIPGVTVNLIVNDVVISTTTTITDGYYIFTNLTPGVPYVVEFVRPGAEWNSSPKNSTGSTPANDSNADVVTGRTDPVILAPSEHNPTIDAGFYQLAGLGDFVWEDRDADGIQDPGELPIPGVVVSLLRPDGTVLLTTTTTITGHYEFLGLTPGDYVVHFATPGGMTPTQAGAGSDPAVDSNADPITGRTAVITLTSGEYNPTIDAGFYRPASLGDYVWHDANLNGIQDPGEEPVPGALVTLQRPDGTVLLTATTTITGYYLFDNLTPGDYVVHFTPPAGTRLTQQGAGADPAVDSNANPTTGLTAVVNLESGEHDPTIDAGIFELARLGDYVWRDSNANGIQDPGEAPIPGVTVRLLTPAGVVISTTVTNGAGEYIFEDLVPGDYVVEFVRPDGLVTTQPGQGTNPAVDSNADPVTGRTGIITLPSGGEDLTIDAGYYEPASLGSYTWFDTNRDGIRDPGEIPMEGVIVNLYRPGDSTPIATQTTGPDGYFFFEGLPPGEYQLRFIPPDGSVFTERGATNEPMLGSDADTETGWTQVIVLTEGQADPTWGAGFVEETPTVDEPTEEPGAMHNSYWLPVIVGN